MDISTHVLDTALGRPAIGLSVTLWRWSGDDWSMLVASSTDDDGRCRPLLTEAAPGIYRIFFDTGALYRALGTEGLYPFVEITFHVREGEAHYHIPLLLTPYGYTTYRGS